MNGHFPTDDQIQVFRRITLLKEHATRVAITRDEHRSYQPYLSSVEILKKGQLFKNVA